MSKIYLDLELVESSQPKEELIETLAKHFKGYGEELKNSLDFWEKIASAEEYGLINPVVDYEALENLRQLVRRLRA